MALAQTKYDLLKQRAQVDQLSGNDTKEQFVAMQAEIQALKNAAGKPTNKPKGWQKEWQKVKPKKGDPQTKTVKGKVYHWCVHHQAWTIHNPNECKLAQKTTSGKPDTHGSSKSEDPSLVLSRAYQAILAANEAQEEDSDDE